MATYDAAQFFTDQQLPFCTNPGEVKFARATVAVTAALIADDLVNLFRLPPGHIPLGFVLGATDLDSGGTALTFDLGYTDGTTTDRDAYANESTLGSAENVQICPLTGSVYGLQTFFTTAAPTVPYTVRLQVGVAPTTGAAGTIYAQMLYGIAPTVYDGIEDPAAI
jgi:hypothetical protein